MRFKPRVTLYRRPKSRCWYLRYIDAKGLERRESTGATTRRAAEAVAAKLELDLADPAYATQAAATMLSATEAFLRQCAEEVAAGDMAQDTFDFYRTKTGHLLRVFGPGAIGAADAFYLSNLSATAVDSFISARRAELVKDHTIKKELIALGQVLKLAKRRGLWAGDVSSVMPVSFSPKYQPVERALTPIELNRLLGELTADQGARVAFIVATAANWSDTERATRGDIAEDLSRVFVRGQKTAYRQRTVPIVAAWQASLIKRALETAQGTGDALFLPWGNARRDIAAACVRAGIDHCSPNDLRRTTGTWLRDQGVPAELIGQGVMGHRDGRMMERVYGRMTGDMAAPLLAQHLGPNQCAISVQNSVRNSGFNALAAQPRERQLSETADFKVPRAGIEPATRGFSVPCSTN